MHPRDFQKTYEDKQFGFDVALNLLKMGQRVSRRAWGKESWIMFQSGYPDGIPINANTAKASGIDEGTVCKFLPYIQMKIASVEATFVHYCPNMIDIVSEDWIVIW